MHMEFKHRYCNGDEQADTTKPTEVWEVINNQKPSLDAADNIG